MKVAAYSTAALLLVAVTSNAQACLPPPPGYIAPRPPQTVLDTGARKIFEEATYIAEVVVLQ